MTYYEDLQRLWRSGINIPLVIYNILPDSEVSKSKLILLKTLEALGKRGSTAVLIQEKLPKNIELKNPLDIYLEVKEQGDSIFEKELVILKGTKSIPLLHGKCIPGPYWNRISVSDSEYYNVIWGVSKDLPFPIGLRRAILELNDALQAKRLEYDGSTLYFTFHSRGEGIFSNRILVWGIIR